MLGEIFQEQRQRLCRMIELRMDPRLRQRIDPSDVLQECYIQANARLDDFLRNAQVPVRLWLRMLAGQQLVDQQRHHLGARMRAAGREVPMQVAAGPEVSSAIVADWLIGADSTPSRLVAREELHERLIEALEGMSATDREVLVLRHFEHLDNIEVAALLDLSKTSASNRYVRALKRLRDVLAQQGLLPSAEAAGEDSES